MFALAQAVAEWSKDPERGVGAVLTRDRGRALFTGYNGFPAAIPDDPALLADREARMARTVHAEVNAVMNASAPLSGWTAYVTQYPCHQCALLLVTAGVARVVCPPPRPEGRWFSSQVLANEVFLEALTALVLV
jgi:dCMP deaminase